MVNSRGRSFVLAPCVWPLTLEDITVTVTVSGETFRGHA